MILADDVGQPPRPQPVGQRMRRLFLEQRAHSDSLHGGDRARHHPPERPASLDAKGNYATANILDDSYFPL
jgi:hypothetical protein